MQTANMARPPENNTQLISIAQDYIKSLQAGEMLQAEKLLLEINRINTEEVFTSTVTDTEAALSADQDLYCKVGKLTRELHDSMASFLTDTRVHMMTNEEMPDARQRLQHVVNLTEQSAHTTMSLIENSNPLLKQLDERATVLQQQLHSCKNNNGAGDAIYLNEEFDAFLHLVTASSKNITKNLNEIMLAQNYQDLTGQVIQRVSTLVQEVENNLLSLLQPAKVKPDDDTLKERSAEKNNSKGYGPVVPGVSSGEVLKSQEDVDDLLSSLGF